MRQPPGPVRRPWRTDGPCLLTIALAFGAGLLGTLPFADDRLLTASVYFYDDNFYYFEIARHLAAGRGFTFDGLHATNGFQLSWQLLLVPLFALVQEDMSAVRAVLVLETSLLTLAAFVLFRILAPRLGRPPALAAALFLVAQPGSVRILRAGMESAAFMLVLVLLWRQWLRTSGSRAAEPRAWAWLGLLCLLAFLTRIEALVVLAVVVCLEWRRLAADPRAAAAFLGPPLAGIAAYLVWNRLVFGLWLPVSMILRFAWAQNQPVYFEALRELVPVPSPADAVFQGLFGQRLAYTWLAVALQGALVALLAAMAWRARRFVAVAVRRSGASFVLVSTFCFLVVYSLGLARVKPWQRVPLVLCLAVMVGLLAFRRVRLARRLVWLGLAGILLRLPLGLWQASGPKGHSAGVTLNAIDTARWLSEHLEPSEKVGSWNAAGALGYFSSRTVINLDGLVNDAEFLRSVLREGRIEAYIGRERVSYLADPMCGSQPAFGDLVERVSVNLEPEARTRFRTLAERRFELVRTFNDPSTRDACAGMALWRAAWLDEGSRLVGVSE